MSFVLLYLYTDYNNAYSEWLNNRFSCLCPLSIEVTSWYLLAARLITALWKNIFQTVFGILTARFRWTVLNYVFISTVYMKKLAKSQCVFQGVIQIKPPTEEVGITFCDVKYEIGEEIRVNER